MRFGVFVGPIQIPGRPVAAVRQSPRKRPYAHRVLEIFCATLLSFFTDTAAEQFAVSNFEVCEGGFVEEEETGAPRDAAALRMPTELGQPEVEPVETPDVFLAGVSEALKASANVDADLATILSDHLLNAKPHADAVANAKAAIVAIAAKRAAPDEEQSDG
ncbi:hypothetical protein [Roseovarius sp. D0-M9]|uniref:hypothetical protein n=1 Tax=Roseovarius sp. D0-M9 TaxID=3127117 RepID=UPI0030105E84